MDNTRDEMRRLIDVIEKGARSASVAQVTDDMKTFSNTASFLGNTLDTRLKKKGAKPKMRSKLPKAVGAPRPPRPSIPKSSSTPRQQDTTTGMPNAISTAISQADYDRLKPQTARVPLGGVKTQ